MDTRAPRRGVEHRRVYDYGHLPPDSEEYLRGLLDDYDSPVGGGLTRVEGNVRLMCPGCRTWMIVMPPEIFQAVGDLWGVEGEVRFKEHLAGRQGEGR
jgi:hypothetical protein